MTDIIKKNPNEFGWLITEHITAMLAYWDNNQVCRFANSAYREWFGKTPDEMIGKITLKELLGPLYEKNLPFITGALGGTKQVFEREIPLPSGGSRHSIATYYPDIAEGYVRGFFVHVADVTSIKLLEAKFKDLEKLKKREILRSIIETQEKEKEIIAYQLRDGISQTLAYCKMMLDNANKKETDSTLLTDIANIIHQAINEMNRLSRNLSPTLIADFGFKDGLEDYIINFEKQYKLAVQFKCENEEIEELAFIDKISVFRIVQDLLRLLVTDNVCSGISVTIQYTSSDLSLWLTHDDLQFKIPTQNQEFINIQNRLEYYGGSLTEKTEGGKYILLIGLNMIKSTNQHL